MTSDSRSDSAPICLAWQINASTGWGLYGLHLAIQLLRLGRRVYLSFAPDLTDIPRPLHALLPSIRDGRPSADERLIVVSALGNNFAPPAQLDLPNATYHVGLTVFEDTGLTDEHVANLKQYDRLLAPSQWCQAILARYGIDSTVCHQGYDDTIFHPAPRIRPRHDQSGGDGRILVFSGGKLEYRKGQDLAIAAFREFRHTPEGANAVLVTAWHNPWPATMEGIWNAGHVKGVPKITNGVMELTPWLALNGIPAEAHMDLGQLTQLEAAAAIRECDVAIFPNRCEGATNMVLSECLGMGVPSIFGSWTGHAELLGPAMLSSTPAEKPPNRVYRGTEGWREMSIPALVTAMQSTRQHPVRPATWAEAALRFNDLLTIDTPAMVNA